MALQPTLNKFRTSLTQGKDYLHPSPPVIPRLSISATGIATRDRQIREQKLINQKNEWELIGIEADVHTAMNNAHEKVFGAMESEYRAAQRWQKTLGAEHNYEAEAARTVIAEAERNYVVASVPVELKRYQIQFGNLIKELERTQYEALKLEDDIEDLRLLNELNNYRTELKLPTFERPKVDLSKFRSQVLEALS